MKALYNECIDKGAHPNPAAAFETLRFQPRPHRADTAMTVVTQSRNPSTIDEGLRFVAETGIAALEVMSVSCRSAFQSAGIRRRELDNLKRRVALARPYRMSAFEQGLPENDPDAIETGKQMVEGMKRGLTR